MELHHIIEKSRLSLQNEAIGLFLKMKGYASADDVPLGKERDDLNAEYKGFLQTHIIAYEMNLSKLMLENFNNFKTTFSKEAQLDTLKSYFRNDYAVWRMLRQGILKISSKKSGAAFGKVKGMELSANSIPIKVSWDFGCFSGTVETSYLNLKNGNQKQEAEMEAVKRKLIKLLSNEKEPIHHR